MCGIFHLDGEDSVTVTSHWIMSRLNGSVMTRYLVYWIMNYTCLILPDWFSVLCSVLMLSFQERTLEEHKKLVERILKHDQKRRKRIEAAGIDYECPEIVSLLLLWLCGCSVVFTKIEYSASWVLLLFYICNWSCRWVTSSLLQRKLSLMTELVTWLIFFKRWFFCIPCELLTAELPCHEGSQHKSLLV